MKTIATPQQVKKLIKLMDRYDLSDDTQDQILSGLTIDRDNSESIGFSPFTDRSLYIQIAPDGSSAS